MSNLNFFTFLEYIFVEPFEDVKNILRKTSFWRLLISVILLIDAILYFFFSKANSIIARKSFFIALLIVWVIIFIYTEYKLGVWRFEYRKEHNYGMNQANKFRNEYNKIDLSGEVKDEVKKES